MKLNQRKIRKLINGHLCIDYRKDKDLKKLQEILRAAFSDNIFPSCKISGVRDFYGKASNGNIWVGFDNPNNCNVVPVSYFYEPEQLEHSKEGAVVLRPELKDCEWYTNANALQLFIHLLLSASHVEKKWRGKTIFPGDYITTYKILAHETGLSVQNVRTVLKKLADTGHVQVESNYLFSIVSVVNFNDYVVLNEEKPRDSFPKRGDMILVSDDGENWHQRIFLAYIEGSSDPVIVVDEGFDSEFLRGCEFDMTVYVYWKPLLEPEPLDLTMQQIAEKFGVSVDQLNIIDEKV